MGDQFQEEKSISSGDPVPGVPGGGSDDHDMEGEEEIEVIYDEDDEDFEVDEWEGGTDGDLADDEGGDDDSELGAGMFGFTGEKPAFILNAHLESAVYCAAFDGSGKRLLTGGGDDMANMWDDSSKDSHSPICKCRGHSDSIVSSAFNWDSSYFSTADLSGMVKVWSSSTFENTNTFEVGDLSWSFWHRGGNVLFAGCDDGAIYMWKIPTGDCKILTGSSVKCECAALLPDGKRLVAGYADGGAKIFDLKSEQVLLILVKGGLGTPGATLCTDVHESLNIACIGSSDGLVKLFNTSNGKLLHSLHCSPPPPVQGGSSNEEVEASVESVAFSLTPKGEFLAAGSVQGEVAVWDVAHMTERLRIKQEFGLTKLVWDPLAPVIYTGGLDGVIRMIDVRTCKIEKILGRHHAEVLDLAVTKDGKKLVSASEAGTVFIFNLKV